VNWISTSMDRMEVLFLLRIGDWVREVRRLISCSSLAILPRARSSLPGALRLDLVVDSCRSGLLLLLSSYAHFLA